MYSNFFCNLVDLLHFPNIKSNFHYFLVLNFDNREVAVNVGGLQC